MKLERSGLFLGIFFIALFCSCSSDDNLNGDVRTSETAHLYAASHSGPVKRYDINTGQVTTYNITSTDTEGIYFSQVDDSFTLASRSGSQLETYTGISTFQSGISVDLEPEFISGTDLESPRDLAVNGNFYIVSDDTDLDDDELTPEGRLFIYTKGSMGFTLRNVVTTKFRLWGIEFIGDDLYAAVDETNKIAVFRNFISTHALNRIVTADKIVAFQGLVRSHGLDFEDGTMILSDIGEAESNSDGALHVIQDFESKFNAASAGGFVKVEDQLRIAGNNTLLGNPVDVIYDSAYNVIFVAEAVNGGGRILAFNDATSIDGNISPDLKYSLAGVSSLFFHTE
ncbi:hypothetical protein NE848_08155 [Gramella jeungdoensis]|uniref:Uncharacterized protein n=1 Tax=Gramella jeungdoensis TaxID=708091 RepID=A0ABT0Z0U9_9FLAO|nr:hypothetical protein [Gramella jeungdoensis]MCM8569348.1 hypothetical protein [Gramella jeungdoensis]